MVIVPLYALKEKPSANFERLIASYTAGSSLPYLVDSSVRCSRDTATYWRHMSHGATSFKSRPARKSLSLMQLEWVMFMLFSPLVNAFIRTGDRRKLRKSVTNTMQIYTYKEIRYPSFCFPGCGSQSKVSHDQL
jgi:hypothetical protein